jgi:hypothetical protein
MLANFEGCLLHVKVIIVAYVLIFQPVLKQSMRVKIYVPAGEGPMHGWLCH